MLILLMLFHLTVSSQHISKDGSPRCQNGIACPHIIFVMVDDLGWNNVPWHDPELAPTMPTTVQLVHQGIELNRHYAFVYCSPSRSSFLSGRLPYHVNQVNLGTSIPRSGIPRNMTTLPRKLKQGGYATHSVGKWHLGCATPDHTPQGRGFDTSLGFFAGAEDHWTQRECIDRTCNRPDNGTVPHGWKRDYLLTDLWHTDGPASDLNNTAYGDHLYTQEVLRIIGNHNVTIPLFFYIAFANNHSPLEAPPEYRARYPADWQWDRREYAAMGSYWDEALGNITKALEAKGMWKDTLLVLSADNGGPNYPTASPEYVHCGGANNWPLKGGKVSIFEGGVRVSAFVSGGFIPEKRRGTQLQQSVHISDWFATFCGLAGVDPSDFPPGLPGVDSVDLWPVLSGASTKSPHEDIVLALDAPVGVLDANISGIIVGDYKLVAGFVAAVLRQGPASPNASSCCGEPCWALQTQNCGTLEKPTCLYDIRSDPRELVNLAKQKPEVVAQLQTRLLNYRKTLYNPDRGVSDPAFYDAALKRGGFVGPWLN